MSENTDNQSGNEVKLGGLFAHKVGMSSVYGATGEVIPVTVLKMEPWIVSQVKTKEKDGYEAVQIASRPRRVAVSDSAQKGHLKKAGFEHGAYFIKEVRQALPEGVQVGQKVAIESFSKGDVVSVTSRSKGRGFAGAVKRFNFAGGPAAHGSKFHRQPGSSGNRTWPGRVMPGKRMPGHFGDEQVTVRNLQIVDVMPQEGVLLVKGAVPGARHTLVRLVKEN